MIDIKWHYKQGQRLGNGEKVLTVNHHIFSDGSAQEFMRDTGNNETIIHHAGKGTREEARRAAIALVESALAENDAWLNNPTNTDLQVRALTEQMSALIRITRDRHEAADTK